MRSVKRVLIVALTLTAMVGYYLIYTVAGSYFSPNLCNLEGPCLLSSPSPLAPTQIALNWALPALLLLILFLDVRAFLLAERSNTAKKST